MARLFGLSPILQRAISVETGIQNTPVAFAIILLSFADPIQSQMLWLAVLYASFIVMTSSIITLYYRKTGRFDWEVYKNTSVHNRLFGDDYMTSYPNGYLPKRIRKDPSQGASPAQRRERWIWVRIFGLVDGNVVLWLGRGIAGWSSLKAIP